MKLDYKNSDVAHWEWCMETIDLEENPKPTFLVKKAFNDIMSILNTAPEILSIMVYNRLRMKYGVSINKNTSS